MGKHKLENNIRRLFKRKRELDIDKYIIRQPDTIYEDLNKDTEVKNFNREVLKYDLFKIKHSLNKLNTRILSDLNDYFDTICVMAGYNPDIFKKFFYKLLKNNENKHKRI